MPPDHSALLASDNYCIKAGYRANPSGNLTLDSDDRHYWTPRRIHMAAFYQYQVYGYAARLARERELTSVIDVGCGPAVKLMKLLAPICKRAVGVDQASAVTLCQARYPQGEFYADNFESPTWSLRGEFDLVVCADVIEHVADPDVLLQYIAHVARPGAYLVVSTPERDVLRGHDCMYCPKAEHVREWNTSEFRQYLTTRGLEVIEHRPVPDMSFNWSKDYFDSWVAAVKRGTSQTCQMAICRM